MPANTLIYLLYLQLFNCLFFCNNYIGGYDCIALALIQKSDYQLRKQKLINSVRNVSTINEAIMFALKP